MNAIVTIEDKKLKLQNEVRHTSNPENGKVEIRRVVDIFNLDAPLEGVPEYLPVRTEKSSYVPVADPDYVFEPSILRRILLSYVEKDAIMLTGLKGTGKTSFVTNFWAALGTPGMVIPCGPGVDEDYLLGRNDFDGQKVRPVDGLVSYCVRHGLQVCFDEISALRPSVVVALNDVLEKGDVITLKHHGLDPAVKPSEMTLTETGHTIVRHPYFRVWATDNGGGKAVRRAANTGINTLNEATRSRFTYFNMNYMKPALELKALKGVLSRHQNGLTADETTLKAMIVTANRVRMALSVANGSTMDTISFRELKRWANKYQTYGCIHDSFVDAIFTGLEEPSKPFVAEVFETEFLQELKLPEDAYFYFDPETVAW